MSIWNKINVTAQLHWHVLGISFAVPGLLFVVLPHDTDTDQGPHLQFLRTY